MFDKVYSIVGKIEVFPQKGGWYFVRIPISITKELNHLANRGLIAVHAELGVSKWKTSLMPMGDGTHFLALNKKVMKQNSLTIEDEVEVRFTTQ